MQETAQSQATARARLPAGSVISPNHVNAGGNGTASVTFNNCTASKSYRALLIPADQWVEFSRMLGLDEAGGGNQGT